MSEEEEVEVCQTCDSERLSDVGYKTRSVEYEVWAHDGVGIPHVPFGAGIGSIHFTYCLDCGQIQGKWPAEGWEEDVGEWRKLREEEEEARRPMTDEEYEELMKPKGRSHAELTVLVNQLDAEIYEGDLDEETKKAKMKEREQAEKELYGGDEWGSR